jgi:eukaryotic-like serine/threonine-protein kinase
VQEFSGATAAQSVSCEPKLDTNVQPSFRRIVLVATAVSLALLIGGGYLRFHARPILTEKDKIVIADFINTTGDPVFDSALKQGVALQLEQSPYLRVVSDGEIQETVSSWA